MKKVLKILGGFIGLIVALIIIASIVIIIVVDKEFIEEQMKSALHRHVTIEDISVGIFSVVSGIEVENVKISNYMEMEEIEKLKGKPVPENDVFASMESFKFNAEFLPMIDGKFILKELVLYKPQVNVVRGSSGAFNFDDLLTPKPLTAEEKAELAAEKAEEEAAKAEEPEEVDPNKPVTVDDIPVAISIGKIGMEDGNVNFYDAGTGQTIVLYGVTALVKDIEIDPEDLEDNNSVTLDFNMGIKTEGKIKSQSVKSFDVTLAIDGTVKPFETDSRELNPEVSLVLASPKGTITGLQIFENMKNIEQLSKYCGKLDFLSKAITWNQADCKVWYKGNTVKLQDGSLKNDEFEMTFEGQTNIATDAVDLDLSMILAQKHKDKIQAGIEKNLKKIIVGKLAKYVKADKVTEVAMKPLLNEDGQVYFVYDVGGTLSNPKSTLVQPKLPSLSDLVKDQAGDLGDLVVDAAKEKAKSKAKEKVNEKVDDLKGKFGF